MRAALPDISEEGRCEPCGGKRPPSQLGSNMKTTKIFKSKHANEVYQIKKIFNSNSKMTVYLIECRIYRKQYNSSTVTKVCARANNYESTRRNFWKKQKLSNQTRYQKRYHECYLKNDHNGICGREITKINQGEKEIFKAKRIVLVHSIKDMPLLVLMNVMFTLHIRQGSLFIVWM